MPSNAWRYIQAGQRSDTAASRVLGFAGGLYCSSKDMGPILPTHWMAPEFDESTWPIGPGVLGYPAGEILPNGITVATVLNAFGPAPAQMFTHYFRTRFLFTNEPANLTLLASNLVDDGAVIYLNGTEIFRIAMPGGPISATTPASSPVGDAIFWITNIPPEHLVKGINVVAVELHQSSAVSGDAIFGLDLRATFPPEAEIVISNSPANLTVAELSPASLGSDSVFAAELVIQSPSVPLPPFLRLHVTRDGAGLQLRWSDANATLETATSLAPDASWTPLAATNETLLVVPEGNQRFYRLRR